jgi:hypothetical protein
MFDTKTYTFFAAKLIFAASSIKLSLSLPFFLAPDGRLSLLLLLLLLAMKMQVQRKIGD